MIWLLAGIVPPILWALVNHTDKYLLSKASNNSSVEVLMVYSTGFSLVLLPILFLFSYRGLFFSLEQVGVQIIGGILLTLTIYFYLKALDRDEASIVMPLSLLVPVFGYIFSYFLLHETLSVKQLIACILILFGSLILTLEFREEKKIQIKYAVFLLMLCASIFQAGQQTLFKFVTIENSLSVSLFWLHVGITISGFFLIFTQRNLFKQFVASVKANGKLIFGVNFVSELMSSIAYMVQNYATLLAPIAIIMSLNGYQPVFVFLFGILLTIFVPKFVKEKIEIKHLVHKGVSILIIVVGTILIAQG